MSSLSRPIIIYKREATITTLMKEGSKVVVLDVKPGFVVKTKTMGKGGGEERRRKVLVNACGAREVPKHHHPLVVSPDFLR